MPKNLYGSKTPAPPTTFTRAQLEEGERRYPGKKQPFGYSLYNKPWLGGPLTYLFGAAAGGPQKASADEKIRQLEEKKRLEKEIRLREERIRKANADKERLRQVHAETARAIEKQEELDRQYRKEREEEGRGHAIP